MHSVGMSLNSCRWIKVKNKVTPLIHVVKHVNSEVILTLGEKKWITTHGHDLLIAEIEIEQISHVIESMSLSMHDIKIQLDNKAERTQTKERINMPVQFPLFVSSQPRYQAEF